MLRDISISRTYSFIFLNVDIGNGATVWLPQCQWSNGVVNPRGWEIKMIRTKPQKGVNIHSFRCAIYRQTSNISDALVGNKIVDHSHVGGASPVGAAPTTSSFSTNILHKYNCKTRRETFKFSDLVRFILEIWRYVFYEDRWLGVTSSQSDNGSLRSN